jgi:peptidoglycan hydrolase-like protein with peptidoglycan-binding domain
VTTALKNHPGMWLADAPANAINALEDKYGVIKINDAGRTPETQQSLINRWYQGGTYNRPPYLYQPYEPAENGPHVRNGGEAVDVYNYTDDRAKLNEFGFEWYGPSDPVHYTFKGWNGAGSGAAFSNTVAVEQNYLNVARGEKLAVDGIRGPKTVEAYARYQTFLRAYGYTGAIDGEWGPHTQEAHAKYYAEWERSRNTRPSSKTAGELTYADIQSALNRHGYNLAVDNVWGPISSNALADFQSRNGLTVDRLVGPATWDKLNR